MLPNFLVLIAASFVPMILGYIWFHPALFGGDTWYDLAKLEGDDKSEVGTIKLLVTMLLNFLIAFGLYSLVVHQFATINMVGGDIELLKSGTPAAFLAEYGDAFRTFKHGAFHGLFPATLMFAVPVIGYVTIFEKKSFKYFLVYTGYWAISLSIMGGILCQWGVSPL